MKTVSAIAIAAALYGGAQLMRAPADPPVDSIVVGSIGAPEPNTYRLVANGTEAECVVSRGADISVGHSGTVARLVVAPECGRVLPGMDKAAAEDLVAQAHKVCPYSNATRGNIDVTLTVV